MQKSIIVKYEFVGFHKWINAPRQVGFLKNEHRHMFHIEVEFGVTHNDRDLEFFLMREQIKKAIDNLYQKHPEYIKGYQVESCEQIAQDLCEYFDPEFEIFSIKVDEDGDNGSKIYRK